MSDPITCRHCGGLVEMDSYGKWRHAGSTSCAREAEPVFPGGSCPACATGKHPAHPGQFLAGKPQADSLRVP